MTGFKKLSLQVRATLSKKFDLGSLSFGKNNNPLITNKNKTFSMKTFLASKLSCLPLFCAVLLIQQGCSKKPTSTIPPTFNIDLSISMTVGAVQVGRCINKLPVAIEVKNSTSSVIAADFTVQTKIYGTYIFHVETSSNQSISQGPNVHGLRVGELITLTGWVDVSNLAPSSAATPNYVITAEVEEDLSSAFHSHDTNPLNNIAKQNFSIPFIVAGHEVGKGIPICESCNLITEPIDPTLIYYLEASHTHDGRCCAWYKAKITDDGRIYFPVDDDGEKLIFTLAGAIPPDNTIPYYYIMLQRNHKYLASNILQHIELQDKSDDNNQKWIIRHNGIFLYFINILECKALTNQNGTLVVKSLNDGDDYQHFQFYKSEMIPAAPHVANPPTQ